MYAGGSALVSHSVVTPTGGGMQGHNCPELPHGLLDTGNRTPSGVSCECGMQGHNGRELPHGLYDACTPLEGVPCMCAALCEYGLVGEFATVCGQPLRAALWTT